MIRLLLLAAVAVGEDATRLDLAPVHLTEIEQIESVPPAAQHFDPPTLAGEEPQVTIPIPSGSSPQTPLPPQPPDVTPFPDETVTVPLPDDNTPLPNHPPDVTPTLATDPTLVTLPDLDFSPTPISLTDDDPKELISPPPEQETTQAPYTTRTTTNSATEASENETTTEAESTTEGEATSTTVIGVNQENLSAPTNTTATAMIDEVRSAEAVQVDSEKKETLKTKIVPFNAPTLTVNNTPRKNAKRVQLQRRKKVSPKPHDNSVSKGRKKMNDADLDKLEEIIERRTRRPIPRRKVIEKNVHSPSLKNKKTAPHRVLNKRQNALEMITELSDIMADGIRFPPPMKTIPEFTPSDPTEAPLPPPTQPPPPLDAPLTLSTVPLLTPISTTSTTTDSIISKTSTTTFIEEESDMMNRFTMPEVSMDSSMDMQSMLPMSDSTSSERDPMGETAAFTKSTTKPLKTTSNPSELTKSAEVMAFANSLQFTEDPVRAIPARDAHLLMSKRNKPIPRRSKDMAISSIELPFVEPLPMVEVRPSAEPLKMVPLNPEPVIQHADAPIPNTNLKVVNIKDFLTDKKTPFAGIRAKANDVPVAPRAKAHNAKRTRREWTKLIQKVPRIRKRVRRIVANDMNTTVNRGTHAVALKKRRRVRTKRQALSQDDEEDETSEEITAQVERLFKELAPKQKTNIRGVDVFSNVKLPAPSLPSKEYEDDANIAEEFAHPATDEEIEIINNKRDEKTTTKAIEEPHPTTESTRDELVPMEQESPTEKKSSTEKESPIEKESAIEKELTTEESPTEKESSTEREPTEDKVETSSASEASLAEPSSKEKSDGTTEQPSTIGQFSVFANDEGTTEEPQISTESETPDGGTTVTAGRDDRPVTILPNFETKTAPIYTSVDLITGGIKKVEKSKIDAVREAIYILGQKKARDEELSRNIRHISESDEEPPPRMFSLEELSKLSKDQLVPYLELFANHLKNEDRQRMLDILNTPDEERFAEAPPPPPPTEPPSTTTTPRTRRTTTPRPSTTRTIPTTTIPTTTTTLFITTTTFAPVQQVEEISRPTLKRRRRKRIRSSTITPTTRASRQNRLLRATSVLPDLDRMLLQRIRLKKKQLEEIQALRAIKTAAKATSGSPTKGQTSVFAATRAATQAFTTQKPVHKELIALRIPTGQDIPNNASGQAFPANTNNTTVAPSTSIRPKRRRTRKPKTTLTSTSTPVFTTMSTTTTTTTTTTMPTTTTRTTTPKPTTEATTIPAEFVIPIRPRTTTTTTTTTTAKPRVVIHDGEIERRPPIAVKKHLPTRRRGHIVSNDEDVGEEENEPILTTETTPEESAEESVETHTPETAEETETAEELLTTEPPISLDELQENLQDMEMSKTQLLNFIEAMKRSENNSDDMSKQRDDTFHTSDDELKLSSISTSRGHHHIDLAEVERIIAEASETPDQ